MTCPSGWSMAKLGDLGEVNRGRSRHRPRYAKHLYVGPYPFIQTGDIRASGGRITAHSQTYSDAGLAQSRLWPTGTMCITIAANIAETAILTYPACFPDSVVGFVADPVKANVYFIEYMFRKLRTSIQQQASGSVQDNINLATLDRLRFPIPSVPEQLAIANVLRALDDKIEQNRRTAQALELLARAIFHAWFVDFEPVKAKAAGATAFPSMPQSVFDALPTRFVESDIGPVPEGWKVGAIKCLATISKAQINPQDRPEEFVDHFSLPAYDAEMRPTVEAGTAIKSNKFLVVPGCVLFSKLNPRIARVWLPPLVAGRRQIASTEFLVFIPRQMSDRHYLYCQFQQTAFREKLTQDASGTSNSHQRVRPDDVLNRPVIVPTAPIRIVFAGIADPLFALMSENQDEAARLATMRDYLLPKLLSGDVHVETAYG